MSIGGGGAGGGEKLAAQVRVGVDDSQVKAGLDRTNSRLKAFAAQIRKEGIGNTLVGAGAAGGIAGALVGTVGTVLTDHLSEMVTKAKEFQKEMGKVRETTLFAGRTLSGLAREQDSALAVLADHNAKINELEQQRTEIAGEQVKLLGRRAELAGRLRDLEQERSFGTHLRAGVGRETGGLVTFGLAGEKEGLAGEIAEIDKVSADATQRLDDLRTKLDHLRSPQGDPVHVGALNQLTQSLKEQTETYGLTGVAAQLYTLKLKGLNTGAASALALQLKLREAVDAVEQKAGEAAKAREQQLVAAGKALEDSLLTPMERLTKESERLNELLAAGAISWTTWFRAAQQAIAEKARADAELLTPAATFSARGSFALTGNQFGGSNTVPAKLDTVAKKLDEANKIARETLKAISWAGGGGLWFE
jgi:hypothetical protein